MGLKIRLI